MKSFVHVSRPGAANTFAPLNPALRSPSLLRRKCACGGAVKSGGECERCQAARQASQHDLRVNETGGADEREADRVADAVMQGAPVARPAVVGGFGVQRKDPGAIAAPVEEEKSEGDKYKEAAGKIAEAFLETEQGKALKDRALKQGEKFVETVEGKVIAGAALGGALTAIIASNSELPVPIPEVPLDFIAPGLKGKLTYEGPTQKPTNVSLVLTTEGGVSAGGYYKYAEAADGKPEEYQAGLTLSVPLGASKPAKPGPSKSQTFRAETARMAEEQRKFRESMKTPQQRAAENEAVMNYVLSRQTGGMPGMLPGLMPPPGDWDPAKEKKKKKKTETPVQRKATGDVASATAASAPGLVREVVQSPGRPLDAANRSFMESRFGRDFGRVRVHADQRAGDSARAIDALAYTVGEHVVFDPRAWSPHTASGRHLLAHELTHVLQQEGGSQPAVQRQVRSDAPFAGNVPERALPGHTPRAPRLRRVDAVNVDGFPVTENLCDCEDTLDIMEERINRSIDAFKSCYQPGMLVNRLYSCAKQRLYTPYVGAEDAAKVPPAAHTSSKSGAIEWPDDGEVEQRMDALGHRTHCRPLVFETIHRHERQHIADFDAIALKIGPEFFAAFKELEGDVERLEKLRAQGFENEVRLYEARAVNLFTIGPAKALRFELNAYDVELDFVAKLRAAFQQVCRRTPPPPRQPDVPRPEPERPPTAPLWPTMLNHTP